MNSFVTICLFTYSLALFCSIAVLEMVSVLLSLVALVLFIKEKEYKDFKLSALHGADLSLIAFNVIIILSVLFGPMETINWKATLNIFKISIWYWALRYLILRYYSIESFKKGLPLWSALVLTIAFYTIVQFFTGVDLVKTPSRAVAYGQFFRPVGFFSMALTQAYNLSMGAILLLPFAFLEKKKSLSLFYSFCFFVASVAIVLTLSRGAWASFFLSLALLIWLVGTKKQKAFSYLALFAGLTLMATNSSIQGKIMDLFNPEEASQSYRLTLWQAYFEMYKDHWLLGTGWRHSEPFLPQYLNKIGEPDFEFLSHAHSNYVQILASLGSLGLLSFLAFVLLRLKMAYELIRSSAHTLFVPLGAGFLGVQLVFHMGGLTEATLLDSEVTHMLFSQYAVLGAVYRWRFGSYGD